MAAVEYPPLFTRDKVDGLKVVKDEVLASGLSAHLGKLVPIHGTRVLTLSDGTVVHGCRDCKFTGTRGEVTMHRAADHGAGTGGHGRGRAAEAGALPSSVLPADVRAMPLGEVLDLAAHIGDWETILAKLEEQLADKTAELADRTKELKTAVREHEALKRRVKRLIGED